MIDAKKQNRIILGTAIIATILNWIGYAVFGLTASVGPYQPIGAHILVNAFIFAMTAGVWVMPNEAKAVAYTEQIPLVPQKTPWEEEEYVGLKTHAAKAIWHYAHDGTEGKLFKVNVEQKETA